MSPTIYLSMVQSKHFRNMIIRNMVVESTTIHPMVRIPHKERYQNRKNTCALSNRLSCTT